MQYFFPPADPQKTLFSVKIANSLLTRKQWQHLENDDDTDILSSDRLSGRKRPLTTPK